MHLSNFMTTKRLFIRIDLARRAGVKNTVFILPTYLLVLIFLGSMHEMMLNL